MACQLCPKVPIVPEIIDPAADEHVYRETLLTTVVGVDGKPYALNQPLVPPGHFPRGMCKAYVKVKGMNRLIDKPSCVEVFNEAMDLYRINDEPFWFVNLWLNLNLQWIPRVAPKYQLVTVAQLEEISHPVTP